MTGAWNPSTHHDQAALAARRERLLNSVRCPVATGCFDRVVLADATLRDDDRRKLGGVLPGVEIPVLTTRPQGRYRGPSYLEALLYGEILAQDVIEASGGDRWVKVSGGYVIDNLRELLDICDEHELCGLTFLHQHPLRPRPRWALSAFYILQGELLREWLSAGSGMAERARTEPLEGLLLEFFRGHPSTRIRAPYPRLDAYFSTSALPSSSPRLWLHFAAWRALSRLGLYALAIPGSQRGKRLTG